MAPQLDPAQPAYALRAAATTALERGAETARAQECLGHASVSTARLYDKGRYRPEESLTYKVESP